MFGSSDVNGKRSATTNEAECARIGGDSGSHGKQATLSDSGKCVKEPLGLLGHIG